VRSLRTGFHSSRGAIAAEGIAPTYRDAPWLGPILGRCFPCPVFKEARELAARAQDIEDAVYDLKAVNPNKQAEEDIRTPAELLDTIEAKGREVAEALAQLRSL
jgi:hypothetical protein